MRGRRGGPGEFAGRRARAEQLLSQSPPSSREPLALLARVLRHQESRVAAEPLAALSAAMAAATERVPLLDLELGRSVISDDVAGAFDAIGAHAPEPLQAAGRHLVSVPDRERDDLVDAWLDDPSLLERRLEWWIRVAAGPVLESAAGRVQALVPDDWRGSACPVCGGQPQASVIAEESGEFMAGSPRSLVCGRCATWWAFPRITCIACGEEDPRRIDSFLPDGRRWLRIDACQTCRGYVKTFDRREAGGRDIVPLVDDVATLALDVWAVEQGYTRPASSLAGV